MRARLLALTLFVPLAACSSPADATGDPSSIEGGIEEDAASTPDGSIGTPDVVTSPDAPVTSPDTTVTPPTDTSVPVPDTTSAPDTMMVADTKPPVVVDGGPIVEPGDPGTSDVKLTIRTDLDRKAINPLIYGTNGGKNAKTNRQTIFRSGGNRLTAYNWENNASNAGNDWCFQNDNLMSASDTAGEAIRVFLADAKANGAAALVTVPIVDYVAADKIGGGGPPSCPNDVRKSGANYLDTRFKKNKPAKGSAFSYPPSTTDDSVYQDEFVSWVKGAFPDVKVFFSLDNEPDIWASTHAEVHKDNVGYDELVKRNTDYAKAIKNVWPEAKVTGFVSYGWYGYVTLQDAPDRAGKGEFVDYYLSKMKAAETAAGKRLVDYLDLHWYPEAQGGTTRITGPESTDAIADARMQAPRSLWDSTYKEKSWVADAAHPIRLIPRMLEKIAKGYPGTELAFTEWHFGGGGHISGAIATADVLGIFGREGVSMAQIWWHNPDDSFTEAGLQAFRNFDGAGGAFGDTSVRATTSDVASTTVYASIDAASPSRVIIVAINKRNTARTAGITVAGPAIGKAKVYTITAGGGAKPVAAAGITTVATNAFKYTMPAHSISILVPTP